MAKIYVPVSGGLESTRILEMALAKHNFEIAPVYMNIGNNLRRAAVEIVAVNRILDWFRNHPEKIASGTRLCELSYFLTTPLPTYPCTYNSGNKAPITQQINLAIMGMLTRAADSRDNPSFLIGWIKEDSSDDSLYGYDFTADEYRELASINTVLARIGFYDRGQRPHSLPLWDKKKIEIYHEIDERLLDLIIPNPDTESIIFENNELRFRASEGKEEEYVISGIPLKKYYTMPYKPGSNFVVDFLTEHLTREMLKDYPDKYHLLVTEFMRHLKLSSATPAFEKDFKVRFLNQIAPLAILKEEKEQNEENYSTNLASP